MFEGNFSKFGKSKVLEAIEDFFEHSHQKTLAALSQLPKGTWSASDWLDDDGISDDKIKMAVEVSITDLSLLLIITVLPYK